MQFIAMHVHVHTRRVHEYLLFEVQLTRVVLSIYQIGQLMFLHDSTLSEMILLARKIAQY